MLCRLSGVVFVKHSAPGIFSVCFLFLFFWWHSEGSQSPGDESRDGLTWRFPQWDSKASPWGRDKRGACGRICLSLSDAAVERGRLTEWRVESGGRVLLPASQILQDSVNLLFFAESLKERQQVQQLCVIHIVKPGLDWDLQRGANTWS